MWLALTQPPYGTPMPQSGRRPQHQKRLQNLKKFSGAMIKQSIRSRMVAIAVGLIGGHVGLVDGDGWARGPSAR